MGKLMDMSKFARLGGLARAKKLSEEDRKKIAALGGKASAGKPRKRKSKKKKAKKKSE